MVRSLLSAMCCVCLLSGCAGMSGRDVGMAAGAVAAVGAASVLNPCAGLAFVTQAGIGAAARGLGVKSRTEAIREDIERSKERMRQIEANEAESRRLTAERLAEIEKARIEGQKLMAMAERRRQAEAAQARRKARAAARGDRDSIRRMDALRNRDDVKKELERLQDELDSARL